MNFLRRLFGPKQPRPAAAAPAAAATPSAEPIRVHDAYGREHQLTKEQWRDSVLLPHLEKHRDTPDELAPVLAQALQDGFAAEALPFAAHLAAIDPRPERGPVLHAAALLDLQRHTEAEALLVAHLEKHEPTPTLLANLAKAQNARADRAAALDTLWRALRLDPNHEPALSWFAAHHRETSGEDAAFAALRRVAELPEAWRARLALAHLALGQRELATALRLYDEALDLAPRPVPADLLQQMSGDLGHHAHLPELLRLAAPYYDPARHDLPTGTNLLKAYHDLGQLEAARRLLDRLYAQKRPDWKPALAFWDTELAKTRLEVDNTPTTPSGRPVRPTPKGGTGVPPPNTGEAPRLAAPTPATPRQPPLQVTLLAVEGPVWLPPDSPAAELFPTKGDEVSLIAFLGASAELPPRGSPQTGPGIDGGEPSRLVATLPDTAGRLSRALPLWLAEQVELQTNALARTLVPWVVQPRTGFILGGAPWDDATASRHARAANEQDPSDYLVITHLRCRAEPWTIELRLVRTIDAACLATASVPCSAADPGATLPELTRTVLGLLATHAEVEAISPGPGAAVPPALASHYLLRLEQLLAVRTAGIDPATSTLNGEREVLDGQLHLCLDQPESLPARLILAHTLRAMKRVRPAIPTEFRERVDLLQKEKPLPEPAQSVVARVLDDAW